MAGFKEGAPGLLACVLILMIPAYITLFARIYVRTRSKAWGADDWSMAYAAFPFFIECLSGILGAYYGLGQHEGGLSPSDLENALLWWNVFSFFYCNSTLPIKLGITLQICRIAKNNKRILWVLYVMMALNSLTLLMVFIFQLSQCTPVAYNWDKTISGGHCLDQKYLTIISYTMSGVNITTDWISACLPIPLLWNVQMNLRRKISVGLLLGLGVLGSVAALVRLKYTVALSDATDFTYNLGVLACWTFAEPGIGYIAGNLATLRPLFKSLLKDRSSGNEYSGSRSRGTDNHWRSQTGPRKNDDYLELEPATFLKSGNGGGGPHRQTHISAQERRKNSSSSILVDSDAQNESKGGEGGAPPSHKPGSGNNITVSHEVQITHEMV